MTYPTSLTSVLNYDSERTVNRKEVQNHRIRDLIEVYQDKINKTSHDVSEVYYDHEEQSDDPRGRPQASVHVNMHTTLGLRARATRRDEGKEISWTRR